MHHPVLQLEAHRREALLAADAVALETLLSDALVYVHSTAARDSKESYVRKIRDGTLRYLRLEFCELVAQAAQGTAWVTGRMSATVLKDGQERQVASVFLTLWVQEAGGAQPHWRLRAHQGTPLP